MARRKQEESFLDIVPVRGFSGRGRSEILDPRVLHPHDRQIRHEGRKRGLVMDADTILTLYAITKIRHISIHGFDEFWKLLDDVLDRIEKAPSNRRVHIEKFGKTLLNEAANEMLETMNTGIGKLQQEVARSGYPDRWLVPRKLGLLERLFPPRDKYEYEAPDVY